MNKITVSDTDIDWFLQDKNITENIFSKSSWKGWQNVNKRETKVTLSIHVVQLPLSEEVKQKIEILFWNKINKEGFLHITSQEHRTQVQNLNKCKQRLKKKLLKALHHKEHIKKVFIVKKTHEAIKNKKHNSAKKQSRKVNFEG